MGRPWLLGSALLLLAWMQANAAEAQDLQAWSLPQDPPAEAIFSRGPPTVPSAPPDAKTPETIMQLSGTTTISACADLQQLFSDLLDSGNIFSRNLLCYLDAVDSTSPSTGANTSTGNSSSNSSNNSSSNSTTGANVTQIVADPQGTPLFWFILSAVLPSHDVAERAVLLMGHSDGADVDSFLAFAGVPCDGQLIATTQTEDQDLASVYVYSCNGMLTLPGISVPLTLPALCCSAAPRAPRQASPPLPPSTLPPWIEEVEPPPQPPPRWQPPPPLPPLVAAPARPPPPRPSKKPPPSPPGSTDRAQLTLFVMAPPDRLYCSKLLMACETLAQPYGLAYGNYSCRASYDSPAADARYGVAAATVASVTTAPATGYNSSSTTSSVALTAPYVIVKAAWAARAYVRSFKRLQAALASSIDVFTSLGLVPCGTEVRAVLLGTSGTVHREDAFGCVSALPDDYQAMLVQAGLRVLPRQQLCCRPPPPPLPPPLPPPPPQSPPPRRRPPQTPPLKPAKPAPPPAMPAPANAGGSSPMLPSPGPLMGPTPGDLGGWVRPPPGQKNSSAVGDGVNGGAPSADSSSSPPSSQVLSKEAISVIAVLAAAALASALAALIVLYRRRQSPIRAAGAGAAGLPPIIGFGDDFPGGDGAAGASGSDDGLRRLQPLRQDGLLGGWVGGGKDGMGLDVKAQAGRRGAGHGAADGTGTPGGGRRGGGGMLLTLSGSVGSSSVLTEQSSAGEGLPVLMREAAAAAAGAANVSTAGASGAGRGIVPYGGIGASSLEFRDGDMADSVAVVRAFAPGAHRLPPLVASQQQQFPPSQPPGGTGWMQPGTGQGGAAAPDGSGFGLMDVFRGAAANHFCLSTTNSAAPSAAGVLAAAGGSGGADTRPWSAFHHQEASAAPSPSHQHQQHQPPLQQRRAGEDGSEGRPGPADGAAAARRGNGAAEPPQQQQLPPGYPGLMAREVTLLDLFNQSPLAGAMLSTPSTSSGGAPASPTSCSRSRRTTSGGGAGAAGGASVRSPSLDGLRQRNSPAIALERLSVQLAWNIARLSCSVEVPPGGGAGAGGGDGVDSGDERLGVQGLTAGRGDARQHGRGARRGPVSGPQPRLPRWTSSGGGASCAEESSGGSGSGDGRRARGTGGDVGSCGGSGAAGSSAASEVAASGGQSSGTSGTAGTSSAGAGSGWGRGTVLAEPSTSAPAPPTPGAVQPAPLPTADRPAEAPPGSTAAGPAVRFAGPVGGGGPDLDISPKELRIQTDGLLGAGAFGSVYRGSYRGQPVAIKVLHHLHFAAGAAAGSGGAAGAGGGGGIGGAALMQQKDVDSFRQEIAILRMLAHPNIVRVLGGCAHAGHPFLVMELMPRCLHNVIHGAGGSRLALGDALRIATDVARGLAHLHPAIVHRDLKPANILLDARGTAKISDFGLARYHLKPYISTQQPDAGSVAYMAPEGFDPAIGRLSAKCDVYSFGVLLWELITKEHPWAGESNVAIIYRVAVHRMRLAVPTDPRVCPPRLAALLGGCMSYLPSERPDMRHVLSELEMMHRLVAEGGVEALLAAGAGPAPPSRPTAAATAAAVFPPPPPPLRVLPSQAHAFEEGPEGAV